jgi:pentapeptide MXKDX repeat protein
MNLERTRLGDAIYLSIGQCGIVPPTIPLSEFEMIRVRNLVALFVLGGMFALTLGCGPAATTAPKKDDMMKDDKMKKDDMMKKDDNMMKGEGMKDDKMKKGDK